jgi:diguanylate cyclase (GGDEF)-like protein
MKALVIEDTLTSATVICQQLRSMGLDPVHARDGASGLEMFKADRPDLVLLDIIMPGLSGFDVARRIRQLEQNGDWTPIIFLTARASDEDMAHGVEVGGDDYLVKPVSEVVLRAKVRAMQRIAQMRYSLIVLTRKLDDANRELTRLSSVDGLTGIANRRHFDDTLLREWRRAARSMGRLALLAADVDFFKQFNDGYGHQAGDECLKAVAGALASVLKRPSDLVARYGGEEFFAILPDTDAEGALRVAEAMRAGVQALAIPHEFSPLGPVVTASFGVAARSAEPGQDSAFVSLLKDADSTLYQAKRAGRNRVLLAADAPLAV